MSMILVIGRVTVRAEARDQAAQLALRMAEASGAEDGCRRYSFASGLTDPCQILLVEEWESAEALDNHFRQPHTAEFMAALPGLLVGQPEVLRYEVASAGPLL